MRSFGSLGWNAEGPFLGGDALNRTFDSWPGVAKTRLAGFDTRREKLLFIQWGRRARELPELCGAGVRKVSPPEDKRAGQNEQEPSRLT